MPQYYTIDDVRGEQMLRAYQAWCPRCHRPNRNHTLCTRCHAARIVPIRKES